MPWWKWSQTGATNSTADPAINWAEGQAPSSINDSARNMMAETAKYRDDVSGAIVTTGTNIAYLVSSFSSFTTLAGMDKQIIAFTPHATNGGACSLNVDSLGAKNIRSAPGVDLPAGTLIQGTPYLALYNNSDQMFYLRGFFGNPYSIPLGSTLEYWLPTTPNSSFVFPFGQAISRTTYATLFAAMGTTYGAGNGSTTFQLPDLRGCTTACTDNMGGSDRALLASGSLAPVRFTLGGSGGEAAHTLTAAEIPSITSTTGGGIGISVASTVANVVQGSPVTQNVQAGGNPIGAFTNGAAGASQITSVGTTPTINSSSNNTGNAGHNNMQPTILCNRIMRII